MTNWQQKKRKKAKMSCKYCSGQEALFDDATKLSEKGDFYPGIDVWLNDGKLSITAIPNTYEPGIVEACVSIKYCPMCGSKLHSI